MKQEANAEHIEGEHEDIFRVVAEDGDVRPRLESVAKLILCDEFSGFRPPRLLSTKNLTKVMSKTLASGGVLLTCQLQSEHSQGEIVAALLLRPFWNIPSAYEVVAFAHDWGVVFENTHQKAAEQNLRKEYRLLANRTYRAFSAQLKNIGRAQAERSDSGKAIAPALFAIMSGGKEALLEETALGWNGAKMVASQATRQLYCIPVQHEENSAFELTNNAFRTKSIALSSNSLRCLEAGLMNNRVPVPFEFCEVKTLEGSPPAKELCLEKISDIPRGGVYWLKDETVTDGDRIVASIPLKSKDYSFVLVNPSREAECRRIELLLQEGYTVAGSLPIHSEKTYLLFSGSSIQKEGSLEPSPSSKAQIIESETQEESGIVQA